MKILTALGWVVGVLLTFGMAMESQASLFSLEGLYFVFVTSVAYFQAGGNMMDNFAIKQAQTAHLSRLAS